jgi:hypothetical protein
LDWICFVFISCFYSFCVFERYEPPDAEWALANGHLDAPWVGDRVTAADGAFHRVLSADLIVAAATGRMCHDALPSNYQDMQKFKGLIAERDDALHIAVGDELNALIGCSYELQRMHMAINARLNAGKPRVVP